MTGWICAPTVEALAVTLREALTRVPRLVLAAELARDFAWTNSVQTMESLYRTQATSAAR